MEKGNNVHQGHRERTIKKFLAHPDSFHDHELLELLLFYAIPRKDTNPLAHSIINTFGSLENVFKVSADELKVVNGVGDSVAAFLSLIGKLIFNYKNTENKTPDLTTPKKTSNFVCSKLKGRQDEVLLFVLMDQDLNAIQTLEFTSYNRQKVEVFLDEVATALIIRKPKYALIAHNHPSGIADSSQDDDLATKKFNLLCAIHGVNLVDHIILGSDGITYSYRDNDKMDNIKKQADVVRIMEQLKENNNGNRKN